MAAGVDTLALSLEAARSAGYLTRMEPTSADTGDPPLVIVQDASPNPVRNGPARAAVTTLISVQVVARSRVACTDAAEAVLEAFHRGPGVYTAGHLVRAVPDSLPRFVPQVILEADGLYQKNMTLAVVARP